jgi:signal transduction histidine kinase
MMELSVFLDSTKHIHANDFVLSKHIDLLEHQGLAVFVYENDSLKLWSDNSVPISPFYSQSGIDSSFVYLKNAWYVPRTIYLGKFKLVGLILIKHAYQYQNKFLTSAFQKDFNASASVKIAAKKIPGSYPIVDCHNRYLFSLIFDQDTHQLLYQVYIPSSSYFLFIIFLLWVIYTIISQIPNEKRRNAAVYIAFVAIFGVKVAMSQFQFPKVFYSLELFKPQYFATAEVPSLGDLLLWAIVILSTILIFYKSFTFSTSSLQNKWLLRLKIILRLSVVMIFFYGLFFLIRSLIINSTISFEANKLLLFDSYSFFGYIIIMLLFTAFSLYFDKIIALYREHISFKEFILIFLILSVLWPIGHLLDRNPVPIFPTIFLIFLGISLIYIRFKLKPAYTYSALIFIVFCYSIYTVYIVTKYSSLRDYNQKKVLAYSLSTERDHVAEYILTNIDKKLRNDSALFRMISKRDIDLNRIYDYLKRSYLEGYFERYDLEQITICSPTDSVWLDSPDNSKPNCYSFFHNLINERGTKVQESDFYYIDNRNGRINYLGWIEYRSPKLKEPVSLFIDLISKLVNEEDLGYPELLLDQRFSQLSKLNEYSYAKYYRGQLISQFGRYNYNLSSKSYNQGTGEYTSLRVNGQDHLIYRPNKESLIILSSPAVTLLDLSIFFSYTFLVYFLVITVIVLIVKLPLAKKIFEPNFKNKIQFSLMSMLFISLILIGSGTLFFNKRQYFKKHYEIISEKLQSINIQLSQEFDRDDKIPTQWRKYPYNNLNDLLISISNTFYIDVNLYDPQGNLIATSRPEIFEKGLIGTKMNAKAYASLVNEMRAEVVHNEKIGNLDYISGYIPLKNKDNKLLSYINLPYFTRQEELTREVSTMVVAAINIYVLLLLITFLFSVFISRRITTPLRLIQMKFSEIKLGQQYEKIDYPTNDEIGGLVNEYNRMVSELEKSVEMLAKSERESAWREMAKQIAHEINNPLTPMKLSVQHLQRAWLDKNEKFESYLDRISKTLIDEIDNLSAIATEFSNFAKMPKAINERLDLVSKISNVVSLFSNDNVIFHVNLNFNDSAFVFADKEQVSRVFINLFKNAIQSVEKNTTPVIDITLITSSAWNEVRVKDNGKGIPPTMRDRLFRPNFTTKTSGMGLGLAIVKNIIESTGGTINYETEENIGTTFIVRIPVYHDEETMPA